MFLLTKIRCTYIGMDEYCISEPTLLNHSVAEGRMNSSFVSVGQKMDGWVSFVS